MRRRSSACSISMLKNMKYERKINSQTSSTVIFHDGLSHGYDLQTVSPGAVLLLMMRGQTLSFHNPDDNCFLDFSKILQQFLVFALNAEVTFSKDIYRPNVSNMLKQSIAANIRLLSCQKAFFVYEVELIIPGTVNTIARSKVLAICVSKNTRKPTFFPDWWRQKYGPFCGKTQASHFKDLVKPDVTFFKGVQTSPYTFIVPRRDNDWNGHTNGAMFAQYCLDALEHHLCSNNIDCDINTVSLLMKGGHGVYSGESAMGDALTIVFWEDATDSDTVCFILTKSGQRIYKARMQLYGRSKVFDSQSKL